MVGAEACRRSCYQIEHTARLAAFPKTTLFRDLPQHRKVRYCYPLLPIPVIRFAATLDLCSAIAPNAAIS